MKNIIAGILIILYAIIFGGISIGAMSIGFGIPVFTLYCIGLYFMIKGYKKEKAIKSQNTKEINNSFESTPFAKSYIGFILILIALGAGVGTGGSIIPLYIIGGAGVYLIYRGISHFKKNK